MSFPSLADDYRTRNKMDYLIDRLCLPCVGL